MRPRLSHDLNSFAPFASVALSTLILLSFSTLTFGASTAQDVDEPWNTATLPTAGLTNVPHANPSGRLDEQQEVGYQPDFLGLDRSIIGRAASSEVPVGLDNNIAKVLNLLPGNVSYYSFSISAAASSTKREPRVDLRHEEAGVNQLQPRQASTDLTVYISINTCLQPSFVNVSNQQTPPQPSLYVSLSDSNKTPGPASTGSQHVVPLVEGFASASYAVQRNDDIYVSVAAPQVEIADKSVWNYELAISVDAPYHSYNDTGPALYLTDSDPSAALLVTDKLAWLAPDNSSSEAIDQWAAKALPLSIFVANTNNTAVVGVKHSFCGLKNVAGIIGSSDPNVQNGITHNQPDSAAEQQFYVPGLNRSSTYFGFLAQNGNGSASGSGVVGGGGTVFANMTFPTKLNSNCAVIYNLTFCSTVEYAVPANPATFPNVEDLKALYDSEAATKYQNFNYSLQQIPCNTSSTAQYSLARTCDDCASSYKTWLCAVTIPRCEDFTSWSPVQFPKGPRDLANSSMIGLGGSQSYLMARNLAQAPIPGAQVPLEALQDPVEMSWLATNSSRNNNTIAGRIQPGPYNEVLPCEDLCFSLVRDCPASLGFSCPAPGSKMLRASYGEPGQAQNGASLCSAPGSVFKENAAGVGAALHWWMLWGCVLSVVSILMIP